MSDRPAVVVLGTDADDPPPGIERAEGHVELRYAPDPEALSASIADADAVFFWRAEGAWVREAWPRASGLRWIQSASDGVDALMFPELVASDVRNVIDRLKDVSDLRAAEGRRPGVETMKRAALVKQTLGELSIEIGRLEAVASDEPKADENCYAMLAELTRFTLLSTARR